MASKGGTRRKRTARKDDSPLTEPRYLFARDGESLARLAEKGLAECRTRLGELLSTAGPRTIPNLLVPYDGLMLALQEVLSQTVFLFEVHPDPDVRKLADHWYQEAQRFATELSLNRPLYDAFTALDASGEDDETRYALEKILRDFRLSGVDRDEATRARVQVLRDEITAIGQDFDRIIREDVRSITVDSAGELDGLPEDFVEGHAPSSDGKITLTTNYPDSIPVFRYARHADVRRRLQFEYLNRGHPANLDVLARLLARRHELASVLGYDSYAEYIVQDKMVRSSKAVADFLAKVTAASAARAQEDVARLLERKRHDVPGATALDAWDPNYYSELVRAEEFAFDAKLLRPYFAFAKVRDGLFALTGELFGVRYERVSGVPVWHGSVEVYDVYDGSKRLGRFYLDLHPRKDKYTHAAAAGLVTGIRGAQLPQAALMCNFPDPADGPALMDYREVETFFHEFGHLLHSIFQGHGRWVKNTDDGLEWDFIEAPSQMLE
ncbi:MAG: Zn-dependent oligopeptidase, partial [Methanobacteriota archaeon]